MNVRDTTMQIVIPLNRNHDEDFLAMVDQMVIQARNKILKQRLDRRGFTHLQEVMQSVDIQLVNDDLIISPGYDTCKVRRTKCKIPRAIRNNTPSRYYYLGTVDKMFPFEYIQPHEFKYAKYRDFTQNVPMFTIINEYVYIFNAPTLKLINIQALFEKPFLVDGVATIRFLNKGEEELVVHSDLVPDIIRMVHTALNGVQEDRVIDGPDDREENVVRN